MRYYKLKDVPTGEFHDVIEYLISKKYIKGTSENTDSIEETIVDLSYDMIRMLVINYRAGLYQ